MCLSGAVANGLRQIARDVDDAVLGLELIHGRTQPFGSGLHEGLTRGRSGERQVGAVEVRGMGLGPWRRALIRRQARIALDERDAMERQAERFGDQLRLRGIQPPTQLALVSVPAESEPALTAGNHVGESKAIIPAADGSYFLRLRNTLGTMALTTPR
jgi:hypothetical protein